MSGMVNTGRPVLKTVVNKIIAGEVLMTYKTKPGIGRKSVTVGKYQTADGRRSYALIIGGEATTCALAMDAAEAFIDYVGRNDAWNAAHGRGRDRNPA
jgi:hypothetical protein